MVLSGRRVGKRVWDRCKRDAGMEQSTFFRLCKCTKLFIVVLRIKYMCAKVKIQKRTYVLRGKIKEPATLGALTGSGIL